MVFRTGILSKWRSANISRAVTCTFFQLREGALGNTIARPLVNLDRGFLVNTSAGGAPSLTDTSNFINNTIPSVDENEMASVMDIPTVSRTVVDSIQCYMEMNI